MHTRTLGLALALLIGIGLPIRSQTSDAERTKWFTDAKFGLFIHWGLYSQTAGVWRGLPVRGGEHFMLFERIPLKEYAKIADDFNPVNFDAERWVKLAKYAGMKYIVITSKHEEGFSMYDSKVSDYNIVARTPFKRDPLKELAEACKKEGIKLGFYYILGRDWEDPDVPTPNAWRSNIWDYPKESEKVVQRYLDRKVYPQLKELLTGYGDVAVIWFDVPEMVTSEQSEALVKYVRSLQPNCLINDRVGNGFGDFATREKEPVAGINSEPWELCMTMGRHWGYNVYDVDYKTPETLIRYFTDVVGKGGNVLLNCGPTGKGEFSTLSYPCFEGFHVWMEENSEAIYGTNPWKSFGENYKGVTAEETYTDASGGNHIPDFRFTAKDNNVYVIVRGIPDRNYTIVSIKPTDQIKKVSLLGSTKKVSWKQTAAGLEVTVPERDPNKIPVYVLKAELK